MEMAQAYQRLGAQVTVVAEQLLPKDEPEKRAKSCSGVFEREGMRFLWGGAKSARREARRDSGCDRVAERFAGICCCCQREGPVVADLDLEKAGVQYSEAGHCGR